MACSKSIILCISFLWFLTIIWKVCSHSLGSLDALTAGEACAKNCDTTYPLHTYPNVKHTDSCQRGCRFYTLVTFLDADGNVNSTRELCRDSCMEAYCRTNNQYACHVGCSIMAAEVQMPTASGLKSEFYSSPFMQIGLPVAFRHLTHGMMGISWSLTVQRTGSASSVIVVSRDSDVEDPWEDLLMENPSLRVQLASDKRIRTFGTFSDRGIGKDYIPGDWLGCVSRSVGVPRWILAVALFGGVVVVVWLCLAAMATAPKQHVIMANPRYFSPLNEEEYDSDCEKISKEVFPVKLPIRKV